MQSYRGLLYLSFMKWTKHLFLLILLFFSELALCAQSNGDIYVVIVSGGRSKLFNYERYWNDCAFLYRTLRHDYHLPKHHFSLLIADGDQPATDMLLDSGAGFVSSPTDLDNDGDKDLTMAATSENLNATFQQLAGKMTVNDHLFLFCIDHGEVTAEGNAFLWLWNNEQLSASSLATMLRPLQVASINILMGQCHAGAFVPVLMDDGRILTAACAAEEMTWACADRPYDEFIYHWICAIARHDERGNAVQADQNGDGRITMDEAFDYAHSHDRRPETSQLWQNHASLALRWSFDSVMSEGELGIHETETGKLFQQTYDLQGRRHTANRLAKGVYIKRGRLVLK